MKKSFCTHAVVPYALVASMLFSLPSAARAQHPGPSTDTLVYASNNRAIDAADEPSNHTPEQSAQQSTGSEFRPEEPSFWTRTTLGGSILGLRPLLESGGLAVSGTVKNETWRNFAGGISRSAESFGLADLTASFSPEELFGIEGTSAFLHILSTYGGGIGRHVGDVQGISNIESMNSFRVYELYIKHDIAALGMNILAGLYDLNSEFYQTPASGMFLNSSFGVGKEFSQAGMQGPSVFPNTSVALRVSVTAAEHLYCMAAVLDGVPGDPLNPANTSVHWDASEGVLMVAEAGWSTVEQQDKLQSTVKLAGGLWKFSGSYDDVMDCGADGLPVRRSENIGAYLLFQRSTVLDNGRTLSMFARFGVANSNINVIASNFSTGIVVKGIVSSRPDDQFGVAYTMAAPGVKGSRLLTEYQEQSSAAEQTIEASYQAFVTPWLKIQPDVQYVVHPGCSRTVTSSLLFGIRTEIGF